MPVVVCSSCKVRINVKDEMLGKKAKCPKCATLIVLREAGASDEIEPDAKKPKVRASRQPEPAAEEDNPFGFDENPPPTKAKPERRPAKGEIPFEVVEDEEDEPPVKKKPARKPAPEPVEESNPFAIDESPAADEDEPRVKTKPARKPAAEESEPANPFAIDESPTSDFEASDDDSPATFEVDDPDEAVAEKPMRSRRKSGSASVEVERPQRRRRSESGRGGGDWGTARRGLQIVYFAVIGLFVIIGLIGIVFPTMMIMAGPALAMGPPAMPFDDFPDAKDLMKNFPDAKDMMKDFPDIQDGGKFIPKKGAKGVVVIPPKPAPVPAKRLPAGVAQGPSTMVVVFGIILLGLYGIAALAGLTMIVGQILCCFAPPETTARSRMRMAMYSLIALIVVGILGTVAAFALGIGGMMSAMPAAAANNPQAGAKAAEAAIGSLIGMICVLGLVGLCVLVLSIVYNVFWVLFHASIAEHFGDEKLRSQCIMYLVAIFVVPLVSGGVQAAISMALATTSFMLVQIISAVFSLIVACVIFGWYLYINRRCVALIDRAA